MRAARRRCVASSSFRVPPTSRRRCGPQSPSTPCAPTLVLRGVASPLLTDAGAHELVRGIAGAKLVEIAGAGHHVQMERPEECAAAIAPFLAEHAS